MNKQHITAIFTFAVLAMSTASTVHARGEPKGPPPEAFTACESKSSGDTCQMEGRRGDTLTGICETPRGDKLVCAPEGHKERMKQRE